jgi:hypothetical protein
MVFRWWEFLGKRENLAVVPFLYMSNISSNKVPFFQKHYKQKTTQMSIISQLSPTSNLVKPLQIKVGPQSTFYAMDSLQIPPKYCWMNSQVTWQTTRKFHEEVARKHTKTSGGVRCLVIPVTIIT